MAEISELAVAAPAIASGANLVGDQPVDPLKSAQAEILAPSDDERALEAELVTMEADSERLVREGLISERDAKVQRAEVERTRTYFRDLPREQRNQILRDRRDFGRRLVARQLTGASVVAAQVRLNHTRMAPLFELAWPYINRMSINLDRFGTATFGRAPTETLRGWFESYLKKLEDYVDEQLSVAEGFCARREAEMEKANETVFRPSITRASLEVGVEAYTRYSMRVLSVMLKFDKTMDHFDFMVWNGIRDQADVDAEVTRFLRMFNPLSVRGYTTHTRLMRTINEMKA